MNINYDNMKEQFDNMLETFSVKNKKYGNSFENSLNRYGIIAGLTRISDKFSRVENLIMTSDKGTEDESLSDTLLDMANYCTMLSVFLKKQ